MTTADHASSSGAPTTGTPTTPTADAPQRRRRELQPRAIAAVTVAWMFLWDRITWGNLVNGVLVGLVVTLAFPLPSIQYSGTLRPWRVLVLIGGFLVDLVRSSWQVMRLALGPRSPRNAVIEVPLRSRSDFYLTITAELVALVPGSVVIDARRSSSVLYLHLLDVDKPGAIEAQRRHVLEVEERVVRALGSREEIAALEASKAGGRAAPATDPAADPAADPATDPAAAPTTAPDPKETP
ncbi:MAG: hypothetical protein JWP82_2127 [Humibacillus sp.]|nr:hypothetical protein [Humibacillus sp.]